MRNRSQSSTHNLNSQDNNIINMKANSNQINNANRTHSLSNFSLKLPIEVKSKKSKMSHINLSKKLTFGSNNNKRSSQNQILKSFTLGESQKPTQKGFDFQDFLSNLGRLYILIYF
jgi:hypothetical protein